MAWFPERDARPGLKRVESSREQQEDVRQDAPDPGERERTRLGKYASVTDYRWTFITFIVDADELFYGIFNFVKTTNKRVLFHYFYYKRVLSIKVFLSLIPFQSFGY